MQLKMKVGGGEVYNNKFYMHNVMYMYNMGAITVIGESESVPIIIWVYGCRRGAGDFMAPNKQQMCV